MAKNRKTRDSRRKGQSTFRTVRGNETNIGVVQEVRSAPSKVFVEKYLSPKGVRLLANKEISKEEAWEKYGKNRYRSNPESKVIKTIVHEMD